MRADWASDIQAGLAISFASRAFSSSSPGITAVGLPDAGSCAGSAAGASPARDSGFFASEKVRARRGFRTLIARLPVAVLPRSSTCASSTLLICVS